MKNGAILREVEATAELLDVANDFFFFFSQSQLSVKFHCLFRGAGWLVWHGTEKGNAITELLSVAKEFSVGV